MKHTWYPIRISRGILACYMDSSRNNIWWRHQMGTFFAFLAICAGNSPVTGEFPDQRPVTRSFDVFFDLRLNKRLSEQFWNWWFETPPCPLWRHSNDPYVSLIYCTNETVDFFKSAMCKSMSASVLIKVCTLYLSTYWISNVNVKRSRDRLIVEIIIVLRQYLYIDTTTCLDDFKLSVMRVFIYGCHC